MASRFDTENPSIIVTTSPIVELETTICMLICPPSRAKRGFADRLRETDPQLTKDFADFWEDGHDEWVELYVLAERAGVFLSTDPTDAIKRMKAEAAKPSTVPELPSEEPDVRERIQRRIDRLSESAEAREGWASLLQRLWEAAREDWKAGGAAEAERIAQQLRERVAAGEPITTLLPRRHFALGDAYRHLLSGESAVIVTPLALNRGNKYVLQMEGGPVYVGWGAPADEQTELEERLNAREAEAAAFKVFADRTRLGLLRALLGHTASITDLARQFDVSQPTISAHVKILREAGLLESTRRGALTLYRADKGAVKRLLETATAGLREQGL